ncbi:MAG: right-handed parallel beta-helix repeat-containing protein, partial [Planctomycetota bacterium]
TLANSSRYDTGHSIFCFHTDGIRIQYNEAYGNVGDDGMDRGGFDADYNCVNTFIQYNYSHDNMWFCGIMKRLNRNVVIRYNVSQNDKEGIYFYGFETDREARNIHIYNNTHFVGEGLDVSVFPEGRTPINSLFENNIFFFKGRGKWGKNADGINTSFRNNLYFNIRPHKSDTRHIAANPMLVQPGIAGTDIDLKTMDALRGYRLKPGSPCIDTGVTINNHGGKDLLGTKVMIRKTDVGAFERD